MLTRYGPDGPMKFCGAKGCKEFGIGALAIRELFDVDSQRKDGLRVYCRKCRASRRLKGRGR